MCFLIKWESINKYLRLYIFKKAPKTSVQEDIENANKSIKFTWFVGAWWINGDLLVYGGIKPN